MLVSKVLVSLALVYYVAGRAYTTVEQHQDDVLQGPVCTATVTETETSTSTETVTETPSCTSTSAPSLNDTATEEATSTTIDTSPPSSTNDVSQVGNCYVVDGVGYFTTKKTYDFSAGDFSSDLITSNYRVVDQSAGDPWNHGFKPSNVVLSGGFLNLIVPGKQNPAKDSKKAIWGGEVYTTEANILYGSIRTMAIFDQTPGTCQGIFSYHDDNNEIDIEYMGNSSSTANPSPFDPPVFWYTNQPGGQSDNQVTGPAPTDVASNTHEYRIDWTAKLTNFYIDGVLQRTLESDVPQVGSQWVWNNWANGSPDWSTGPPIEDNVFKIQSITMFYNTTDDSNCGRC